LILRRSNDLERVRESVDLEEIKMKSIDYSHLVYSWPI